MNESEILLLNDLFTGNNLQYNYYNNLSEKSKLLVRNNDYLKLLTDFISEMFVIDKLTATQTATLIKTVLRNGTALIEETDKGYIIAPCYYYGVPAPTDIFPDTITANKFDWSYKGKIKPNQSVIYLTPDRTSLTVINRFVTQFSQVDTSLVNNVLFCRISPIISACTSNSKEMYEATIDKMMLGEVKNVITDTINPLTNTTQPLTVTDISKADYAEKIQYLTMLHQDLLSRFCLLFGIDYKHTNKQANLLQDEMKNGDDYLKIYPRMMLKYLNESLEPLGMTAKFNSIWEKLNITDTDNIESSDTENEKDTESIESTDTDNDKDTDNSDTEKRGF